MGEGVGELAEASRRRKTRTLGGKTARKEEEWTRKDGLGEERGTQRRGMRGKKALALKTESISLDHRKQNCRAPESTCPMDRSGVSFPAARKAARLEGPSGQGISSSSCSVPS